MTVPRLNAGPVPLYHQLKQVLREQIERGDYKPGDRLPSEPELIRQYGISRITVRQALDELEAEGLVVRRHGKGAYVAELCIEQELVRLTDFMEDMQQAGQNPSSRVLAFVHEPASPAVARALHLKEGMEVVRVDRLRLADGRPMAYDITWLPLRFGALLAGMNLAQGTIYYILETRYAIPVVSGTFSITAATATDQQADLLEPRSYSFSVSRIRPETNWSMSRTATTGPTACNIVSCCDGTMMPWGTPRSTSSGQCLKGRAPTGTQLLDTEARQSRWMISASKFHPGSCILFTTSCV
jgi:GntR family transcriptional regulator